MSAKKSSQCTCVNLRRAARRLTDIYDTALEPCGINVSQYSLLKHVERMAPVNVSDLAREIRLDRTTLVRNLARLEKMHLIIDKAEPGTRDRSLRLTATGKKTATKAAGLWRQAQEQVEMYLGKRSMAQLTELLAKVEDMPG